MVRQWLYKLRRRFESRVVVLLYHRVADLETDPWGLAVKPAHFEQHLRLLKRKCNVLSLDELSVQLRSKKLTRRGVVITFDDGYEDNFSQARPLLEKYELPATFFIASQFIESAQPFWWDELAEIILNTCSLPPLCSLDIGDKPFAFRLDEEKVLTDECRRKQNQWKWPDEPLTRRCALYLHLWERLKPLPYPEIIGNMYRIKVWAKDDGAFAQKHRPMSLSQLQCLSQQPLYGIGNHTATHLALGMHAPGVQAQDMATCQRFLEQTGARPGHAISYPYGSYNEATTQLVGNKGMIAFTTNECAVSKASNLFCLGRVKVENREGNTFYKRLQQFFK